jgi:SAM-dependent methyltransferase
MRDDPLAPDDLFLGDSLQQFYGFTEALIRSQLRAGIRLLDVGCGDGKLALTLLRAVPLGSVVGVDIRERAVRMASVACNGSRAQFLHGDAQDISYLAQLGVFEAILARTSLHHFRDPVETLRQYAALLPRGGKLILVDIDRESACYSLFGFPLTLLITWVTVLKTVGWRRGCSAIQGMKYPSREWQRHRAVDMAHRNKIGWYRFVDIKGKLRNAFPSGVIGRLAAWRGLGGVHYMFYERRRDA